MTHAAILQRIGAWKHLRIVPAWFDEGLAVYVSNGGGAEKVGEAEARQAIVAGTHFDPERMGKVYADKYGLTAHMFSGSPECSSVTSSSRLPTSFPRSSLSSNAASPSPTPSNELRECPSELPGIGTGATPPLNAEDTARPKTRRSTAFRLPKRCPASHLRNFCALLRRTDGYLDAYPQPLGFRRNAEQASGCLPPFPHPSHASGLQTGPAQHFAHSPNPHSRSRARPSPTLYHLHTPLAFAA